MSGETKSSKKLKLLSTTQQAGNVKTFHFENDGLMWLAGQNQGWDLDIETDTEDDRSHWFTISSAPSEGTVDISTRISDSNYKQALDAMQPGEAITVYDLGGDFLWEDDQPVVFVAGGIGITPFRSILVERHNQGKSMSVHLVYFNRDDHIPFREELDELNSQHHDMKISYIVGEPITADRILEIAPEATQRVTYISGPEPMVEAVGQDLKDKGTNLKQDWFPGYDRSNY